MPFISTTSKKKIDNQYNLLVKLGEKCESCLTFKGKKPQTTYIYSVCGDYETQEGPAMIAVAKFDNNSYAVLEPDYITDKQLVVFEFFLREVDASSEITVFSKRSVDAVWKYSYGNRINLRINI